MASDALGVRKMNLGPGRKQVVMRDGWNPRTNAPQAMNDNGIPKGIRTTLKEHGQFQMLWLLFLWILFGSFMRNRVVLRMHIEMGIIMERRNSLIVYINRIEGLNK